MHYIRLLRPAKIQNSLGGPVLDLLFTITTDLGDSFLYPEDGPLELTVAVVEFAANRNEPPAAVRQLNQPCRCTCTWKAGMRVLDAKVRLRPGSRKENVNCTVAILPTQQHPAKSWIPFGALYTRHVLPWRVASNETLKRGIVMPAAFDVVGGVCAPVSDRALALGKREISPDGGEEEVGDTGLTLRFQEDIGESIARHIWDAGVVTSAYLADACSSIQSIGAILPFQNDTFNVIELGSGVGILGITIASILPEAAAVQGKTLAGATVLLTDLAEAEERARLNIANANAALALTYRDGLKVTMDYENLDWDEGREGRFGPLATTTPWDLVVLSDCTYNVDSLPALVGTLSALHVTKQRHCRAQNDHYAKSSVLLATKPRHSSEQALFDLLEEDDWRYRVLKEIPLPNVGGEDEVVQIYLVEKGGRGG